MLTLQVVTVVVLSAVLGLVWFWIRKNDVQPEVGVDHTEAILAVERRMRALELQWTTVQEELDDRLERGIHAFRKARQAEAYRRRKEESEEDVEGIPQEDAGDVRQLDAFGSDGRGVYAVPDSVANVDEPTWQRVRRNLAQQIAGSA